MTRSRDFGAAASSLAAPSSANNGYNHVVDTTQASGWNFSPDANFNWFINGAADYWQRATTWTADNKFLADRWYWTGTNGGGRSTDVPDNQGFKYSMSFAGLANVYPRVSYMIHSDDAAFLAGKTVTISFWAKNVSGSAVFYGEYQIPSTANTFQSTVNGGGSKTFAGAGAMSTSWQYYTWTFTFLSTIATQGVTINMVRDTASASSTLITGFKMELGSVATPFTRNGGDVAGELIKCQRYYQVLPTSILLRGNSSSSATYEWFPPVTMRRAPTAILATTTPYWESLPYTTVGSLTAAALNDTKLTPNGGPLLISGTYSPSPLTTYSSLLAGYNISLYAEVL
jgi:hypothetical protein